MALEFDLDLWEQIVGCVVSMFVVLTPIVLPYINKKRKEREAYQQQLLLDAMSDVEFLYHAESKLLEIIKEHTGLSMKQRIRLEVELETGRQWSGRFTPGRNNDRRKRMQQH